MLRLNWFALIAKLRNPAGLLAASFVLMLTGTLAPAAYGQDFSLAASAFNPYAINQTGSTLSTVTVTPLNGFSGTVDLGCTVSGGPQGATLPICEVSPASITPPASASLTFTGSTKSGSAATPGSYTVTVAGTDGSFSAQQQLNISVLAVAPSFNVTVQRPIQPNSVHAGSGATAVININAANGYTLSGTNQGVWMSCATISPLVIYPPICNFGTQPVQITQGVTQVTLTIQTFGNSQKTSNATPQNQFWAMWLPLPMLALSGIGATSKRRTRKVWALLGLFILAGALMFVPGCGNTTTTTTEPNTTFVTPKNTYIFTLMGTDTNGVISTDSGTTGAPTVTLTVN